MPAADAVRLAAGWLGELLLPLAIELLAFFALSQVIG